MEIRNIEEITVRKCTTCNKKMIEGFCIDNGMDYYCTKECMEKDGLSYEEFLELYETDDSYYTEWYDEYTDEEAEIIFGQE